MNTDTLANIFQFSIGSFSVEKLFYVLLLILVCFIVSKIILKILRGIIQRFTLERSIQIFLMTGLKILLVFISIIIITEYLGIPTTSLVALLSVVSLAVSLSIQGLLTNVAGGLTVLFTRPFTVGDYIELDTLSGKVTQTGLIYTQLLTPENKTVFLPNSQVANGRIINYTQQTQRRIEIFVGASYSASAEDVKAALFEAILTFPDLVQDPAPAVHVRDYQDSSIQYVIFAWVPTELYWDAYYTLMEEIKKSFDRHHIAMDYPHMNIHMIGDDK
ncbi:MAG: mechanosensitive ion channel family protein [Clostridia bacterium]|nr:mechanosensitive ion channel family protein [Lachnospiraceae bacterium]NCC00929.1 mechanosensitive ion channel family protein [Clostridia bacterium]NCD02411.1 mechanosensitive ion channel family protein [Clostridia bacterium]